METLIPLITLPAIAGLGFLTRKTGYIGEEAFSHLPQLMLRLCYPLLILTSLMRTDLRAILAESRVAVGRTRQDGRSIFSTSRSATSSMSPCRSQAPSSAPRGWCSPCSVPPLRTSFCCRSTTLSSAVRRARAPSCCARWHIRARPPCCSVSRSRFCGCRFPRGWSLPPPSPL